jgi:hypothetical protein
MPAVQPCNPIYALVRMQDVIFCTRLTLFSRMSDIEGGWVRHDLYTAIDQLLQGELSHLWSAAAPPTDLTTV